MQLYCANNDESSCSVSCDGPCDGINIEANNTQHFNLQCRNTNGCSNMHINHYGMTKLAKLSIMDNSNVNNIKLLSASNNIELNIDETSSGNMIDIINQNATSFISYIKGSLQSAKFDNRNGRNLTVYCESECSNVDIYFPRQDLKFNSSLTCVGYACDLLNLYMYYEPKTR